MAARFVERRRWFLSCFAGFLLSAGAVGGATFTVTNAADAGLGSLRAAISNANSTAGMDLIHFDISGTGPFTVNLASPLPPVLEPVIIDGTTQAGYAGKPRIELSGAGAGSDATGLHLKTSNCVVRGLAINRFSRDGIRIELHGSNTIQANFIGTGPFGTNALGNANSSSGFGGLTILSAGNLIGGSSPGERNLISGSNRWGIYLLNATATGNRVEGNYIGVDVTGTNRLGNENDGVTLLGAVANVIGPSNVISGNAQSGVYVYLGATANRVQGNLIGTDASGLRSIGNNANGVAIIGGAGNWVGGTNTAARNLISGNGQHGVYVSEYAAATNLVQGNFIGTDITGTARLGNGFSGVSLLNTWSNTIGGPTAGAGNVISGNLLSGITLADSNAVFNAHVVQGNFIGTDVGGTNSLGNARNGILIAGAAGNFLGGTNAAARNVISGNAENGIQIVDARARSNAIQGNLIGTDVTGTRRLGNGLAGVRVESPCNLVGGASAAERNVISGNTNSHGVYLTGSLAFSNTVAANFIGTDVTGAVALGNGYPSAVYSGVGISSAPANTIGGAAAGARNVISGNADKGIYMHGLAATRNVIQGNYIGTDASGNQALANANGGIYIFGAPTNTIGGAAAGAGNVISGNGACGVYLSDLNPGGAGARFNLIQGNKIGTKPDGVTALGNTWHGVEVLSYASNNIIGGVDSGEANVIAFAKSGAYDGVRVRDGCRRNLVRGNAIFANGGSALNGLGIDLNDDGLTPNDHCDGDDGANALQNFPLLTNALSGGVATRIQGALNSTAGGVFLLQFYRNTEPAPCGHGQGRTYLGSTNVVTDAGCQTSFSVLLPVAVPAGQFISATATDANQNTSEFSTNVIVAAAELPAVTSGPASQSVPFGSNVTFTVTASGTPPLNYQWQFNGTNLAGATSSALYLLAAHPTNAGSYAVTVSNPFGATSSAPAILTVLVSVPNLNIQPGAAGQVTLSWPTGGPNFVLRETTNLTPTIVWTDATNVAVVSNGQFVVTLTPTAGQRFYRLVLP